MSDSLNTMNRTNSSKNALYVCEPFKLKKVKHVLGRLVPRPRSGHRVTCDGFNLYCFGGFNPNVPEAERELENPTWTEALPLFRELWSYNLASGRWLKRNVQYSIPEELASNAACMDRRNLMVYGGTGSPFGNRCSNSVYAYQTTRDDDAMRLLVTEGPAPLRQYGQSVFCHKGSFYTVGGTNGFLYTCDVHRLDFRTLTWEALYICCGNRESEPAGRYRHELAFDGVNIFVLGGGTADMAFGFDDMPVFNLETRSWSFVRTKSDPSQVQYGYPLPRRCHSVVQIHSDDGVKAFVIGGSDGNTVFDDIWMFSVTKLQWTLMSSTKLPKALHFHSSAVTPEGCMYTFGGIELQGNNMNKRRNNDLYKSWLCLPKLTEICWEAILHYQPDLCDVGESLLLNSGIPHRFVERLKSFP